MGTDVWIYIVGSFVTLPRSFVRMLGRRRLDWSEFKREWHENLEISAGFALKRKEIGQKL